MREHIFGPGPGHLPRKADRIARKHDARLVNYTEPRGEKRHWFTTEIIDPPCARAVERAVMADLEAAGLMTREP